jgi:hypothetical protein
MHSLGAKKQRGKQRMKKRDIWISLAIIAGSILVLFSYSRGTGQIEIDAGGAETTLKLKSNWFSIKTITSANQSIKVSAGLNRPQWMKLSMKQGGNAWRLETHGPWGDLSAIRVKNNETAALELGPPFQIKTNARVTGTKVTIDFNIIGRAGERYSNVVMLNDRRAPAPEVTIIDHAGNVLASGKFEYG